MRKKTTSFKRAFFLRLGLKGKKSQQRRGEGVGGKQTRTRKEGGEDSRGRRREGKEKGRGMHDRIEGMNEGGRVIKSKMYPQHSSSVLLFSLFSSLSKVAAPQQNP